MIELVLVLVEYLLIHAIYYVDTIRNSGNRETIINRSVYEVQ